MTKRSSVFLEALGDSALQLHPQVRKYAADPPQGFSAGKGEGVFEVAGSPYRRLAGLLRFVCGPDVAISAYEREVPFTITNRPAPGGQTLRLEAERIFCFRSGRQRFVDVLQPGVKRGTLVNSLGRGGRVEILLNCFVTSEGNLKLSSRAARIRIGSRMIRLPKLFSVQAEVIDGWDAQAEHHTVSVRARNPILGTVLEYRGWFDYEHVR